MILKGFVAWSSKVGEDQAVRWKMQIAQCYEEVHMTGLCRTAPEVIHFGNGFLGDPTSV